MALKYPNKRKRKGYWSNYFKAHIKDFLKVWLFLNILIEAVGLPYKENKRGRPPKFDLEVYAKFCVFIAYFDFTLDEVAGFLPLVVGDSLDRSNVDRWFDKLDDDWIIEATQWLDLNIEERFRGGHYITDSSGVTTDRYTKTISGGSTVLELLNLKLHILVVYFLSTGVISIVNMAATHGDANDSPIFREELLSNAPLKKGRYCHGDKAFNAEETFEKLFDLGIKPNIVPKDDTLRGFYTKKAYKKYDNELRKKIRGLVEGIFGGNATENGMKVRFRKDRTRKKYMLLQGLKHNIRTLFRVFSYFLGISQQPRLDTPASLIHLIMEQIIMEMLYQPA